MAESFEQVLPVVEEELHVGRRRVEHGGVRVEKTIETRQVEVDEPTFRDEVSVERVPVDRIVLTMPEVRREGDVTIIPVVEEVLVTEKRLLLREEIRIRQQRVETRDPQKVDLRREHVEVTPAK